MEVGMDDIGRQIKAGSVSKRGLLGAAAGMGVALLTAIGFTAFGRRELGKNVNPLKGKILVLKEDEYVEAGADDPTVVEINLLPVGNDPEIKVRRETTLGEKPNGILPQAIQPRFAIRLFGDGYPSMHKWGEIRVKDQNGAYQKGGLWFMFTNVNGSPVDLVGKPIEPNQKPFVVAGNFVTVTKTEQEVRELQKSLLPQAR